MRRAVHLVAGALTRFAQARGWKASDYWIFYRTNPDWDRVYFLFVAEGFNDQDSYEATRTVWSHLKKELGDYPEVLRSLGLVVRSKSKVDEGGLYSIGSEYQEYWTPSPAPTS